MRKDLGKQPAVFPMPVLMVTAYDADGTVQVMNAAWGMICDMDKIALFISESHATTKAIKQTKAFTVSLADKDHVDTADYFGIATGNEMPDKFEKSGFHAEKSAHVNAPIITEFPVAMECELAEIIETENLYAVIGNIVNVSADERVIDDKGKIDPVKVNALIFDQFRYGYYTAGERVGQAWSSGKEIMKAAKGS